MGQASLIKQLAWDTEFFGIPIAKTLSLHLQPPEVDLVVRQCEASGVKCLYCEVDPDELATVAYVQQLRFQFVEFRLVLAHDLRERSAGRRTSAGVNAAGVLLDDCPGPQDQVELARIADAISPMSRFAVDSGFGPEASRRLYARWLQNSLADPTVRIIVARREGHVAGFVTIQPHGEIMHLVLLGVAPEARGQGIGVQLVEAAVAAAVTYGSTRLDVVTQGRNVGAVRTYERAGFHVAKGSYYFHKWWE
jgi:ribosomal protein S18 acetylase RimI-like enzyme